MYIDIIWPVNKTVEFTFSVKILQETYNRGFYQLVVFSNVYSNQNRISINEE